jgi:hypothetical protein
MNLALAREDAVVVDDLLPAAAFTALATHLAELDYRSVHAGGWDRAWRLSDGGPLRGSPVYFDPDGTARDDAPAYPTGTPIDPLIEVVRQIAGEHASIVGAERRDWRSLFLSAWLYPVGSGLAFHRDGGSYSGAFTFFVNADWGFDWGGLLLLDGGRSPVEPVESAWRGPRERGPSSASWGTCICPRPNRLALIGPDCGHMITRVDRNAGSNVRATVSGFFLRPGR